MMTTCTPNTNKDIIATHTSTKSDMVENGKPLLPAPANARVQILCEIIGATNLNPHPSLDVVSASTRGILASDERKASSFIKVSYVSSCSPTDLKERAIHTTKPVANNNSPIWAVDTGSVFLLDIPLRDLTSSIDKETNFNCAKDRTKNVSKSSLIFEIHDKDTLLGNTAKLGAARISTRKIADIIVNKPEERFQFAIQDDKYWHSMLHVQCLSESESADDSSMCSLRPEEGENLHGEERCRYHKDDDSKLALRFRVASRQDIRFLDALKSGCIEDVDDHKSIDLVGDDSLPDETRQLLREKAKLQKASILVTDKDDSCTGLDFKSMMNTIDFTLNSTTLKNGTTAYRVKPRPNPAKPEVFLTAEELLKTAYNSSFKWTEAGSGTLGKVYVEVLRCQGLPNLDVGEAFGNLTDAFVSLCFEDAIVQTDTIDDCLSPLWMPWTQRAFCFNMMHPLSALYLAVFDYDDGSAHDGIGRCVINLENMKPNVTCTLKYALYPSSVVTTRESTGTVTVRIRVELKDEESLLLESIKPPPKIHVNVKKEKSLAVVKYTLYGEYDEDKYSMTLLRSYVNEIFEYKSRATYSIGDALKSLILWRGQVKIGNVWLPMHSLLFFIAATHVVERPHLLPSLMCFLAAFAMLGTYTSRVQHPSPWRRCRLIRDFVSILLHGRLQEWLHSSRIEDYAKILFRKNSRLSAYSTRIQPHEGAKESDSLDLAWKNRIEADKDAANKRWEMQQQLLSIGDEKIHTEEGGLQIDPLAKYLFPIQRRLRGVCVLLRRLNCVVTWEDSYLSFWLTAAFIGLGMCLLILPMPFLLYWTSKILVWTVFGPWMKFVDLFFLSSVAYENEAERQQLQEQTLRDIAKNFREMSRAARVQGEDAFKLKAMRILKFGQYIAKVPERNVTRHFDYPLPESTARLSSGKAVKGWKERKMLLGQKLHGRMIQRRMCGRFGNADDDENVEAIISALRNKMIAKVDNQQQSQVNAGVKLPAEAMHDSLRCEGVEVIIEKSSDVPSLVSYEQVPSDIITASGSVMSSTGSNSEERHEISENTAFENEDPGECVEIIALHGNEGINCMLNCEKGEQEAALGVLENKVYFQLETI
mmetsp:Transcript_14215/g.21921  ORF Transcript_14215/g.21921 Transcript_14215/m.21921 type:complete len:1099 (-) Transcript_14215:32-3328(-)